MKAMKKCLCLALAVLTLSSAAQPALAAPALPESVSEAMLSADFWLAPDRAQAASASALIMDAAEISAFNEANRAMIDPGSGSFALTDIGDYVSGELVRSLLACCRLPENHLSLYVNGSPQPQPYWDGLLASLAAGRVGESVPVRFGYSLVRSDLRLFPTGDFAGVTADEKLYDKLVMSEFMPFLPLAVLHESADGNWFYVAMYGFCGWIEREKVALCPSRDDWLARMKPVDFLVVTARELRLPEDPYCPALSGLTLPMGTVLPLASGEEAPELIGRRRGYGCYTLRLPTRGEDGYIRDDYALLPVTEGVHRGFVPYTAENGLRLIFRFLGDRYGWAGMLSANDCSGIIHQAFACFGFSLPRTAAAIMELRGFERLSIAAYSPAEKLSGLESCPAGTLLAFPGHIMVYLGSVGGQAYVLSSAGSFGPSSPRPGYDYSVNTVCVTSLAHTRRRSGPTWLESLDSVLLCTMA